jgi:hypothetical protein
LHIDHARRVSVAGEQGMLGVSLRSESVLGELRAVLFALVVGLTLAACGGEGGSGAAADADAGDERDAGTSDDLDAGADGAEADEPDVGAPTSEDLSGTWIARVETLATESLPLAGEFDVQLTFALRLHIAQSAGALSATFEICELSTETLPEPEALRVSFPPALIATLRAETTSSVSAIRTGDALPTLELTIRSGIDAADKPLDSDADSHPGVTVPANVGGSLMIRVYAGLTLEASIASRLSADGKLAGTADFSVSGEVFGSDNASLTEGMLSVAPKSEAVSLSATRLAGDVPCSEVLSKLR